MEAVEKMGINSTSNALSRQSSHQKVKNCIVATVNVKYTYCQGVHNIYQCKDFKGLDISGRLKHLKSKGLCLNCLRNKHLARDCSSGNCKICSKRHNSLLHDENYKPKTESKAKVGQQNEVKDKGSDNVVCNYSRTTEILNSSQVLLSTTIVKIKDKDGHFVTASALLDNGSQSNFVTLAKRLKLKSRATIQVKLMNKYLRLSR